MVPNWVILAALGGIASNIFNFLSRYLLRKNGDPTSWAWTYEFLRLPVFIVMAFFDYSLTINLTSIILLLGVGLTEFISVYLYMKMHAYSQLSISTIVSRTRLIWIPIIAFLFFGEKLAISEYLGIVLLFVGMSFAVAPNRFFIDKGAIYANLAAFVIAIGTILLKLATSYASVSVILVCFSLPSVLLFPLLMKNAKIRLLGKFEKNFLIKAVATLASAVATTLLIAALKIGDVSKVNAIYQAMMVTGVVAGIILLKERENILKKLIGTALAVTAIFFLT